MDVFSLRERVVEGYGHFSLSFATIKADDIREFAEFRTQLLVLEALDRLLEGVV